MNRWVFNGCVAGGWLLVSFGVGVQYGVGHALMAAGALLILLTLGASMIAAR